MFNKAVAIVLALQMAVVFSMPAPIEEKVVTTVVGDGNQNMQALLDELTAGAETAQGNNKVIKKTTTTTTTTTTHASEEDRLQNLMKDPKFARQLRELLVEFIKMYNAMNMGSSKQVTTTTVKNVDVNSVLNNQSFMNFLRAFMNAAGSSTTSTTTDSSSMSPVSFLNELVHKQKTINGGSSSSSSSSTSTANKVINTDIPITRPAKVNVDVNENIADSLINQLSKTSTSSSTSTSTTDTKKVNSMTGNKNVNTATSFPSRFGVTSNIDVNDVMDHPSISSSESILDELKQQAHMNKNQGLNFHDSDAININVHPGTTSTDWALVHGPTKLDEMSSEEFRQQAKNAHYQFATQVNDGMEGNFQQRAEIRENGVVYGKFSYDDGFFWRTVYYEADINGFRVTKQEVLPSHMTQHTGEASVQSMVNGHLVDYHITAKDISHPSPVAHPGLIA